MLQKISVSQFYSSFNNLPVVDVRSPGEFSKGRIPCANNIPLFSNSERAVVGTAYVQESREKAIEIGYEIVTPKLKYFITKSEALAPNKAIVVHCWRGGMRSQSFAKHLHENGFEKVYIIEGGYKAFRNYVLSFFQQSFKLNILGGYTGSGKTGILKELKRRGEQVIDMEALAHHKGSAFGAINESDQPSVEQFENDLFNEWRMLRQSEHVWLEDESHRIGYVRIPKDLFAQIREQQVYFLDIPIEERAKLLVEQYSNCEKSLLADAINGISRRLGGLRTKQALEYLEKNNFYEVALIALKYYDKAYAKGVGMRNQDKVKRIPLSSTNFKNNADKLLQIVELSKEEQIS